MLFLLTILTLAVGCAPGYYETPQAAFQPEDTRQWHTNPETEEEYHRRIWWMDFETSHPWMWRR
jgi:hypothetical protein